MQSQRETIALLPGDIPGFHQLMESDALAAIATLEKYQKIIDEHLTRFSGSLQLNYFGRGCLAHFTKVENAILCALEMQKQFEQDTHLQVPIFLTEVNNSKPDQNTKSFHGFDDLLSTNGILPGVYASNAIKQHSQHADQYTWSSAPHLSGSGMELFGVSQSGATFHESANNKTKQWLSYAGLALALLVSFALLTTRLNSSNTKEQKKLLNAVSSNTEKSIAVLPFANLSADSNSFFANGMMEDILTNLAKFKDLKVISRTSSMQYESTKKNIPQIASELGVEYVLEGSVRQQGDRVKVNVLLIKAANDEHIWAENYERKLEDLFAIQSEVSEQIAVALNQSISPELSLNINRPPTDNLEAYNALLESRELNRIRTQASMEESLRRLDYALKLDHQFADAIADKAATKAVMSLLGYNDAPIKANEEAEQLALQAIKLDPSNHIAYATLGNIYFDASKWKQSETAFQIAIQNNPNDALANYWYSLKLRYFGRLEEAIHYGSIAAELDPLYPVIQTGHALTCMMGDRMDLAKAIMDKGALLFENYFGYHWVNAYYKMAQQDYEAAITDFNKSQELSPSITSIQRQIIFCKGQLGQVEEVEAYIATQTKEDIATYINLASAYAGIGKKKESIDYIRKAWDRGAFSTGSMYNVKFKSLLSEPEYQALLNEMKQAEKLLQ